MSVRPDESRSILVLRLRRMGDIILMSALFRNLRIHFPQAHLAALVDEDYKEIAGALDLDEAITAPGGGADGLMRWMHLARDLRRRRFDVVIDVADSKSSYTLVRLTGAPVRVGFSPSQWPRPFWNKHPYNRLALPFGRNGEHFLDRYLSPIEALGLPIVKRETLLHINDKDRREIEDLMRHHELTARRFIVVHPGARRSLRCWPMERFAHVIDDVGETGLKTVLIGGSEEHALVEKICEAARTKPINLAGSLSFGQLAALIERSRIFIGNDSGPAHLAAAVKTPVVALFGLQSPKRWRPLGEGHVVVVRPTMPCPCLSPEVCRPPDPEHTMCVRRIEAEEVIRIIRDQLSKT